MAKTKKTLRIMKTAFLDACVDVANDAFPITVAEMGVETTDHNDATYGGKLKGDVVYDSYNAGQAQVITVDYTGVTGGEALSLTVIDVTDGREKFPRRTFTATTRNGMVTAANSKEIIAGDGFELSVQAGTGALELTVSMPAGRLFRVAVNDGATQSVTTPAILPKGYTRAEAIAYAKDFMAPQYGRTNRVGFPVVEPADLESAIGTHATWSLMVVTKVSEVKFDKNQGNSYQDVEEFHFLVEHDVLTGTGSDGAEIGDTTP